MWTYQGAFPKAVITSVDGARPQDDVDEKRVGLVGELIETTGVHAMILKGAEDL